MKTYFFIFSIILVACNSKKTSNSIPNDNHLNSVSLKDSISYPTLISDLRLSTTPYLYFNSDTWKQYEDNGNPDTALALFTYRVIKQIDTSFNDYEAHIRLYKDTKKVKHLILVIFERDTSVNNVLNKIDNLNIKFKTFAEREVKSDIEKFGPSDGLLEEFVTSLNK